MAMNAVLKRYAPSPSAAQADMDNSAPSSSGSTTKAATQVPAYYPHSDKPSSSAVSRDANRFWQVAP